MPPLPATSAAESYDASIIAVSAPKQLAPGQMSVVSVTVKNIGTLTWSNGGKNYVSIYSYDWDRRTEANSVLASPGWENAMRPARLPVSSLAPGQTAIFTFPLKAPSAPGVYSSDFLLVAEGLRRMGNGRFTLRLDVKHGIVTPTATLIAAPVPVVEPSSSDTGEIATGSTKWRAELVSMSGSEWQINMEENTFVTLTFKNVGTETWKKDGASYISVYSVNGNKERESPFRDKSWNGNQAARLIESEVKPGQIGTVKIEIRAPRSPGSYREEFMLAAEDTAWISGGRVLLPIIVPITSEFIASAPPGFNANEVLSQSASRRNGIYTATLLLRSTDRLSLPGDERQQVTLGFKNTSNVPWNMRALKAQDGMMRDDSWRDLSTPVQVLGVTNPGEIGFLTFFIKAPVKKGVYTASFQLQADNNVVEGGMIDIPITVTSDGVITPEPKPVPVTPPSSPSTPPAPSIYTPQPLTGDESSLPAEPMIRAGIFATADDKMVVTAKFAPLEVRSGGPAGSVICVVPLQRSVTVSYDRAAKLYRVSGECTGQSATWYVVHAQDILSPMEMTDFSRPVGWLPGANDNTFRSNLELRFAEAVDQVWVINELPIEWYLKGIAETSNSSPPQYQRALLTGARTYAMYHVQRQTKHAARHFTVDATYDQVYRGYGAEARSPTIVAAVEATRGQIVTYNGKLAITPYFSRSDGRTRDWTEVWGGGPYPWLVSVPVPHDVGKTLWGHGVGLSATGALQMDYKDGASYQQILSHFYRGTELWRVYR
ncbi:MAG: NBR1-Ig-like domain-containing protein [Patescibacteria group bacterium]